MEFGQESQALPETEAEAEVETEMDVGAVDATMLDDAEFVDEDDMEVFDFGENDVEPPESDDDDIDEANIADDDDGTRIIIEQADETEIAEEMGDVDINREPVEDKSILTFTQHEDSIYNVNISKSKQYILSSGGDDKCFMWDVNNGQVKYEFNEHTDTVISSKFNFDDSLIATASYDNTIRIIKTESGELLHVLEGPSSEIEYIEWHPKGNVLLAASSDATVWMFNASNGKCMNVFVGHEDAVTKACFTPNGKRIVTCSLDNNVKFWDPRSAQCIHTFGGHDFHQDGVVSLQVYSNMVLSGSQDGTARLCNLETKKVIATFFHGSNLDHISDNKIIINDTKTVSKEPCSIEGVDFSTDQPWILTAGTDGKVNIYDMNTSQLRHSCRHGDAVINVKYIAGTNMFLSCSADQTIKLFDCRDGRLINDFTGHMNMVLDLDFNDEIIVSASDDKTCKVFDLKQFCLGA